jgi:hypothetical protein
MLSTVGKSGFEERERDESAAVCTKSFLAVYSSSRRNLLAI